MEPLVSIIVPVYNAEKYLGKCLVSLQKQTYANLEIILIDDGSQDNSAVICKSFTDKDKRFKYYYQENRGVSAARNRGLDLASGEFIGFCDSDDWVENDMYETLFGLINSNQSDVSICSYYIDREGIFDESLGDNTLFEYEPKDAIVAMHKGRMITGHLWNKLCRKSAIGNTRFDSNITVFEDMLFMWSVFQRCTKIVYQNKKKYHYIQYSESASHKFKDSFWSVQYACSSMVKLMQKFYPENIAEAQHTVMRGNILLARKLSEAGKLNKTNYQRILPIISKNYSQKVMEGFSQSDRRQVEIFRINRCLYNAYVYLVEKKRNRSMFSGEDRE